METLIKIQHPVTHFEPIFRIWDVKNSKWVKENFYSHYINGRGLAFPNADPNFILQRMTGKTDHLNQFIFEGDIIQGKVETYCGGKWKKIESFNPEINNKLMWQWNYKEKELSDEVKFDCFECCFKVKGYSLGKFRDIRIISNIFEEND